MRIALLNLPLDNNYGGNLQRYALLKVLQDMGHQVEHINLQWNFINSKKEFVKTILKQGIRKLLFGSSISVMESYYSQKAYEKSLKQILHFYNKYINHSKKISKYSEIDLNRYDAVIVGSDQVWRKSMTQCFGFYNYFLSFVPNNILKIGYGISIGNYEEWDEDDINILRPLYKRFDALSVRESQSVDFLRGIGFNPPQPIWVLDPTFLLDTDEYDNLIKAGNTKNVTDGKIFAYILDMNDSIEQAINDKALNMNKDFYIQNLSSNTCTIEQWIRNIRDCEMVITDSYHGVVFSLIYKKPFLFEGNERRGIVRIDSLLSMLQIDRQKTLDIEYDKVYSIIKEWQKRSINFIKQSL